MKLSEKNKDFFSKVYQVVALIPKGKVTNYGSIAKYLGSPRGARMVGWAMNACHSSAPNLPAHRVVNRVGLLSGKDHFPDPNMMQLLLEKEGLTIKENKIQKFENYFWDPMIELEYF
ncbi:MAG: methylated-DNA-protein-cysteine methyltransferase-like protein [Patiriisocius sp.]|jgi:methylated-DNA-protein-cysteine methyltransferase-like protein